MQHFTQVIDGIDSSQAELVGYVIDNSPEMDPDRRRPAILIIPGGGYAIGSDRESEPVALQFLAAGYQAFVLKYSCVPSRYPVALLEMAEAMSMIRGACRRMACGCRARGGHRVFGRWSSRREPDDGFPAMPSCATPDMIRLPCARTRCCCAIR